MGASGEVVVANLQFSWSSSHVGILQFSGSGDGVADKTQIAGTVSGEESFPTVFGGIVGSSLRMQRDAVPFSFRQG